MGSSTVVPLISTKSFEFSENGLSRKCYLMKSNFNNSLFYTFNTLQLQFKRSVSLRCNLF